MAKLQTLMLFAGLAAGVGSITAQATGPFFWHDRPRSFHFPSREKNFQRVGTFANYRNNGADSASETVSEIIAATADGRTLVYTDGVRGTVGLIDITNPGQPQPLGIVTLDPNPGDDVGYSPTSLDVLGNRYALVAANTSESNTNVSGKLLVVDLATRAIVREIELGGQPDSIKISPDNRYAAIVIENERSEDLCVGGTLDGTEPGEDECEAAGGVPGGLPQTPYGNPPGNLSVLKISGPPASWPLPAVVDLTGLAEYAPDDPEPEFVDVNGRNEAVVTLQENNHLAIVDLETLTVKRHFPMGTVTLRGVDATDDGYIALKDTLRDVPREPDAVAWVPGFLGRANVATANEGDLFGGSRGFSIFQRDGGVVYDSGNSYEELAVRHGHYPEGRSGNKGSEPEAIAYAQFGAEHYLFVGSERGSFVAVYKIDWLGRPVFDQFLPAPLGPEGLLAIPERNLLVVSGETDLEGLNTRSTVMIYQLKSGPPAYPQILSDDEKHSPIPWSAMSGLVAVPGRQHTLLGVWDSAYTKSNIFRIDVSDRPAVITDAMTLTGGRGNYDPEGIAVAPDQTLWIASEGDATDSRPNLLIQTDLQGRVLGEYGLPAEIIACRAATTRRGTLGSGFEGVAIMKGNRARDYRLIVAQQRGWDYTTPGCENLDDDAGGLNARNEPNHTRLWIFDPRTRVWTSVAWELAPKPDDALWMGLSEITPVPDSNDFVLIERDNRTGDFAVWKTLVKIDGSAMNDGLVSHAEKSAYDLMPALKGSNGWITDKPEGAAITANGETFVVTDNDGVDDWSGETWFFNLGRHWRLF